MDKNAQGSQSLDTCSCCHLLSVQNSVCQFCQHDQSLDCDRVVTNDMSLLPNIVCKHQREEIGDHNQHNTFAEEPLEHHDMTPSQSHPQELIRSKVISHPIIHQDAIRDQSRHHRQDCRVWGDSSLLAHSDAAEVPVGPLEAGGTRFRSISSQTSSGESEQSSQKEGCVDRVCEHQLPGGQALTQHDDSPDLWRSREEHHTAGAPAQCGQDGVWSSRGSNLRGGQNGACELLRVGSQDQRRGGDQLEVGQVRQVAEESSSRTRDDSCCDTTQPQEGSTLDITTLGEGVLQSNGQLRNGIRRLASCHSGINIHAARDGGGTGCSSQGECRSLPADGAQQESQGDLRACELEAFEVELDWHAYPTQQCLECHRKIGQQWSESKNVFSQKWNDLVNTDRLFLMEVACSEHSALTQEALRVLGDNAAQRCSLFNGYDLTTKAGVQKLKKFVDEVRPVHIWISCDCGPYSPLQHLNQKTEAQKENLRLKREYAQKEYKGAIELARYANPKGSQIHFELSERCEAWNLPFVREFLDELQLRKVTCHGCTVGLRANDTGDLLCKGWSIASRNTNLLRHLHCLAKRIIRKCHVKAADLPKQPSILQCL